MAKRIKDYHRCPACTKILNDPLVLLCDHNICRTCLQESIAKEDLSCQLCGTVFGLSDPRPNVALKAICEDLSIVKSEDMCSLHKEELNRFCLDHQELVCHRCTNAEIHRGHRFRPLKEIVKDYHKELKEGLQKAEERVKDARYRKDILIEQAEYIKAQRAKVERKIRNEFREIRCILELAEDGRLSAVELEEEGKTRAIREQIAVLSKQINVLSDVVSSTRKQLKSDVSFIKKFETAMSRIQELPEMPHLLLEGLLDEAKHVGNLRFKVWEWIKDSLTYIPVIVDPNTANPRIYLSQDLSSLSLQEVGQERPKNPERFQKLLSVLGEALDPGRHVWDVEVGDNKYWNVGVMWVNFQLKKQRTCWTIGFRDGQYIQPGTEFGEWNPHFQLQRIRVTVDTNERSLSFFESTTNTQLWKKEDSPNWPDVSGDTKMFPYFETADEECPLHIIPIRPDVTTAIDTA